MEHHSSSPPGSSQYPAAVTTSSGGSTAADVEARVMAEMRASKAEADAASALQQVRDLVGWVYLDSKHDWGGPVRYAGII